MSLLDVQLPEGTLSPDVEPSSFFDRCEAFAQDLEWRIDRRRAFAGPEYDQLNLETGRHHAEPIIRMVSSPNAAPIKVDVIPVDHAETLDPVRYRSLLLDVVRPLLRFYNSRFGTSIRLGLPRKTIQWDRSEVDCSRYRYAQEKFSAAIRSLAIGEGDVRTRLVGVYMIAHPVKARDLPPPLVEHWEWVLEQLTNRPARHEGEGTLEATLSQMKNSTGRKIAERILALHDALNELCPDR